MGRPAAVVVGGGQGSVPVIVGSVGLAIGAVGLGARLGIGATSIGLTPPLPTSKEPKGIPVRAPPPGVVGDVAAMDGALLLEVVPLVPDIAVPPDIDVPFPIPKPPPSYVVLAPTIPDAGLPIAEPVMPKPVNPVAPVVALGSGLTPGDVSSVAPKGTPVGETVEPGPMPSGDVAPMLGVGLPIPPTWAKAEPQLSSSADAATIAKRVIMGSTSYSRHSSRLPVRRDDNAIKRPAKASRELPRLVRCCFDRQTPATSFQTRRL
jgi:hypothetical protein